MLANLLRFVGAAEGFGLAVLLGCGRAKILGLLALRFGFLRQLLNSRLFRVDLGLCLLADRVTSFGALIADLAPF